jgi:alginate O-acetyltransferase complex protein AlgI
MVFTTYPFLFMFLPAVLALYYALHSRGFVRTRTVFLTIASYVFYGWERPDFCALIMTSTLIDFFCGRVVANPESRRRKLALTISIVGNLSLLGYFKYHNFGMDTLGSLLTLMGGEAFTFTRVALPVGISFYTFQTMSYTIDIYRGHARPARSFADIACYVALFPQLVAGPIVRYRDIDGQLRERLHSLDRFGKGALLFMCGFAKKILLADSAGQIADAAFAQGTPGFAAAWVGVIAYAVQIYFDFSGYSDMAIGLGRMFGFVFPINFASPYRSRSITEFWRRWHISLSTWLRDYLYIPLGGSRKGAGRTYVNLAVVMLLGGLWHGAQWTFVAWGAFHGLLLAFERRQGKSAPWSFLPGPFQVALTFLLVLVGWVFFRADSFQQAWAHLLGMAGLQGYGGGLEPILRLDITIWLFTGLALVLTWAGLQSDRLVEVEGRRKPLIIAILLVLAFVLAVEHMFFQQYSPFLYFQF